MAPASAGPPAWSEPLWPSDAAKGTFRATSDWGVGAMFRRTVIFAGVLALLFGAATAPAHAIHFFNGCGKTLQAAPGGSATTVSVAGFAFTDQATTTSVTHIKAGESVTWRWDDT